MLVLVRNQCSWEGTSYPLFRANWHSIEKVSSNGWCLIDGVVKVKTMAGKVKKSGRRRKEIDWGQKAALSMFFKLRHWEEGRTIPHRRVPLFLDRRFRANGTDNPTSNYTERKVCFLSIECCQPWWVFLDQSPSMGAFQSVFHLGLCVV
jgi:hypothetical protein